MAHKLSDKLAALAVNETNENMRKTYRNLTYEALRLEEVVAAAYKYDRDDRYLNLMRMALLKLTKLFERAYDVEA